ncbi:MAG: F0F1 ATP synthase subunit B [Planctomycetes bacterium]|nr:F0F1 ATP synthase subunit B [Planctomycetota bacterium]
MLTKTVSALAASFLTTLAAAAPEGGHGGIEKAGVVPTVQQGIVPMLVGIAVFLVVLAVLSLKVWPTILKGLKDREDKIRTEIESAEFARQQAKDALEQYNKSLAEARAEAQKMLDQTRAQQVALAAELKAKADAELTTLREKAMKDIAAAKQAAVSEIYAEAANLASTVAGKILRREINAADQRRLVEESLTQLQSVRN